VSVPARSSVVWTVGPALAAPGVPETPTRDVMCEICGDKSLRATCRSEGPIEQWITVHAGETGHEMYTETRARRLRAVPLAWGSGVLS
jgi:hypothetical protein